MDLIERQAAIDLLRKWSGGYAYIETPTENAVKEFEALPSAEPEKPFVIKINRFLKKDERERVEKELNRKLSQEKMIVFTPEMELLYPTRIRAKWVRNIHDKVICTQCGMFGNNEWNFCPNCGADMRGDG